MERLFGDEYAQTVDEIHTLISVQGHEVKQTGAAAIEQTGAGWLADIRAGGELLGYVKAETEGQLRVLLRDAGLELIEE